MNYNDDLSFHLLIVEWMITRVWLEDERRFKLAVIGKALRRCGRELQEMEKHKEAMK